MRVKRLELFGFKSFARKTTVNFEPGVTAIVGPNGSGKCVHGDSRVVLADGRVVPIRELVEAALAQASHVERWEDGFCTYNNPQRLHVLSLNPLSLKVEARPIAAFVKRSSPDKLYRVVTKTGRTLIATAYHPLFTLQQGKLTTLRADELKPGMRIAIPRRLPIELSDDRLDSKAIARRFDRADSVYLPHSPSLERWVRQLADHNGGLTATCRAAGVERGHVNMVRAGQALNVATMARLEERFRPTTELSVTTLQGSRGDRGAMRVPQQLTPELARFLGYCISEGRVTSANQVWFVNSDPALIEDFCQCAKVVFGLTARVLTYKPTAKDVLIFSRALCRYLERALQCAIDQPSAQKRVPDVMFRASDSCVAAFLSALFEGDGHLSVRHAGTHRTLAHVEYATASRRLAEDVCLLFARFGIVGRIRETHKAATNTPQPIKRQYFSVMVYGVEQLNRFGCLLQFRGEKRHALQELRQLRQAPNPNDDVIPGATQLVKALVQSTGIPVKRARVHWPTLAAYHEGRCEATRPGLIRALDAVNALGAWSVEALAQFEELNRLARSDIYWDELVQVDIQAADQWVYDLSVEGHHNFIANGIIVHNSNIVDSIRWVLGEHNPRDVRAPRLEDVIFNGTDRTAPLSMAEVSLTIANEQGLLPIAFSEVTITRRVYRSGESECLINQSPCRLKDVHELFLGTGLGGGTYAIIEQGHIDMILSSKPEERRVVFEEASGVAKYLSKKHETMRRLDETEEHLVRIADIIGEVRRQVGALERQANKARQYKTQWEQLKQLELRLAVDELSSDQARASELEAKVQTLNAQRDALEAKKQEHVTSLEGCNASVSAIQQQLQQLRTRVVECSSQIEQHQSQFALKTRWIEELTQQLQQLAAEETQFRLRLAQIDEQLARVGGGETELIAQLSAIDVQLGQGASELAALETSLQASASALQAAKAELFDAASTASHQRNQLAELTSRLQHLDAQAARLEEQRAQRTGHSADVQRRRDALQQERESLQQQHEAIERQLGSARQAHEAAGARRHELTGRVHQLRDQVASARAQAKLAESLWRQYEGFPDTVKTLMSRSIDGVIGPLVDLLQAAPGSEEIVEAALGPLAEALVVRDRQALARCREALSGQQMEGCRFLVLSDCPRFNGVMEEPVVQAGVSGAVKQHVRTEPAYQPLVDWILNDSWVVDDLNRWFSDGIVPPQRLVTPRGDRWDRRSWRFRGTSNVSQNRVGRKQRCEQSQSALQSLEEAFLSVEAQAKDAETQWHALLGAYESAKGQAAHIAPSLHKLETQTSQLTHELKRLEEEQRARELELAELVAQRQELSGALSGANQQVEAAQARQQAAEQQMSELHSGREGAEQRRQQLLIAKAQVDATRQSVAERLDALHQRAKELADDRAQIAQQAQSRRTQQQDGSRRIDELTQQLQAHQQGQADVETQRVQCEAEVSRVVESLQQAETTRDQVLPQLLAVEQQLNALTRQIQEQSQQLSERTYRRAHLVERLRELYQIDEAAIQTEQQANPPPLTDEQRASMSEQVQKLRGKLEGIGPVSLGSVEEYDQLKQRHEFLQSQQQDLIQARDDLKASITQINRTARTQFRETFERIKQEFQHYYTRLFNGGEANLILLDEEDVLECGIDIVARPPGKRLQSITLLSGGERALTAVALLFALFKVRPSPFCILDEIDAPLDEANVDRFTKVLEEFLSLSQFILVTHNKKTITKADSLYGVTMEEPGISKILSAKLSKTPAPAPAPASSEPGPAPAVAA